MLNFSGRLAALFVCAAAASAFAAAPPALSEIHPAPAFAASILSALPTDGWLTNGGNLANQRYSPLTQINVDNVARLKGVWRTSLKSGLSPRAGNQAQPLVHGGVIYIMTKDPPPARITTYCLPRCSTRSDD